MRVDEVALREFLHTDYPRLVAAVALASGSRPAAEDAVQEALLRAWERSEKGEDIESLNAWVTTVALNLVEERPPPVALRAEGEDAAADARGGPRTRRPRTAMPSTSSARSRRSPGASARPPSSATTSSSTPREIAAVLRHRRGHREEHAVPGAGGAGRRRSASTTPRRRTTMALDERLRSGTWSGPLAPPTPAASTRT